MTNNANPRARPSPRLALYRLAFRIARAAWGNGEGGGVAAPDPGPLAWRVLSASPTGGASRPPWESEPVLDGPLGSGGA